MTELLWMTHFLLVISTFMLLISNYFTTLSSYSSGTHRVVSITKTLFVIFNISFLMSV